MHSSRLVLTLAMLMLMGIGFQLGCVVGCDKDALEDVPEEYILPEEKLVITGLVLEAGNKNGISGAKLTVTTSGGVKTIDGQGNAVNEFLTTQGLVSFSLKNATPTSEKPIILKISVSHKNYLGSAKDLLISKVGQASFEFLLINNDITKTTETAGVVLEEVTGEATASGKLVNEMTLTAALKADRSTGSTSITVPKGSTATSADGTVLTGALKLVATFHSSQDDDALDTFPGGLANTTISNDYQAVDRRYDADLLAQQSAMATTLTNSLPSAALPSALVGSAYYLVEPLYKLQADADNVDLGNFLTAGFAAIELLDENGNKAATFSEAVTLRITLDKDAKHPDTGLDMVEGDTIPVWSFMADTARWDGETLGTVKMDEEGNLYVELKTRHFSYWNLDWFRGETCRQASLQLTTDAGKPYPRRARLSFTASVRGFAYSGTYQGDGKVDLYRAPAKIKGTIEVQDFNTRTLIKKFPVDDLCDAQFNTARLGTFKTDAATKKANFQAARALVDDRITRIDGALLLVEGTKDLCVAADLLNLNFSDTDLAAYTSDEMQCWYYWFLAESRELLLKRLAYFDEMITRRDAEIAYYEAQLKKAFKPLVLTLPTPVEEKKGSIELVVQQQCKEDENQVSPIPSVAVVILAGTSKLPLPQGLTDANGELTIADLTVGTAYTVKALPRYSNADGTPVVLQATVTMQAATAVTLELTHKLDCTKPTPQTGAK